MLLPNSFVILVSLFRKVNFVRFEILRVYRQFLSKTLKVFF